MYVTKPKSFQEFDVYDYITPKLSVTVLEEERETHKFSGLYNAEGVPLYKVQQKNVMGFKLT
jgi:hypothetical protein